MLAVVARNDAAVVPIVIAIASNWYFVPNAGNIESAGI
jgi:hypothetical protein